MRSLASIALLVGLAYALPQASSCVTVTSEVIVPTSTLTFSTTDVITTQATTAENLGTDTEVIRISSTKTVETITSTETACTASSATPNTVTSTVYTTAGSASAAADRKRDIVGRQESTCTVTAYTTTTYGVTETNVPNGQTSTFTAYTAFSQATVTTTTSSGTSYTVATTCTTTSANCGPATTVTDPSTTTVTQDARCAPSALTSAYRGFGLEFADDTPLDGATYTTSTSDPSECCQMCTEADSCAASSWDIRTNQCKLEFPVDFSTGELNCGEGLLAFYDAGPDHPMAPGTGLYIGVVCGNVEFGSAPPDDGT